MGIFDYQSGNSQGILIYALGMNPVYSALVNYFSRSRSMTVTIETQNLKSFPVYWTSLNKLKVAEKT